MVRVGERDISYVGLTKVRVNCVGNSITDIHEDEHILGIERSSTGNGYRVTKSIEGVISGAKYSITTCRPVIYRSSRVWQTPCNRNTI
jgi:hypothetical protein